MQISTRIAVSAGMWKVSVVRSAIPSVAVSPGSAPTVIPSSVAQRTLKSVTGSVAKSKTAARKNCSPCTGAPQGSRTRKIDWKT